MSSKTNSTSDQDGKERLLQAAIESFSTLGYEGTSTTKLARAAKVAQPLVYHHFGSKEDLWKAAMNRVFGEIRVVTSPNPDLPPHEALLASLEKFIRFSAEHPHVSRLVNHEATSPSPRLTWLIDTHLRDQYEAVISIFKLGQEQGTLDKSIRPELLLFYVLGASHNFFNVAPMAQEALGLDPFGADLEPFIKMAVDTLAKGLITRGE
ncbi:MAG: TetR/AcrR family transcriptional regulator [Myxococcota bacterium]|nr:TetR/AcrR family transcriptional regulator [Myxococcota bacterium]